MRTLAERIKALRLPGETQAMFAERLNTTQASISRYLNGRQPDRETLIKVAKHAGVSLDWLLTGQGPGPGEKAKKDLGENETLQAVTAYIGDLASLSAKEKTQLQSLVREAVENKETRKEILAHFEGLGKGKK
jgi:transcriptional regulator with XRE-family HTH domain